MNAVDLRGRHLPAREIARLCFDAGWTHADHLLEAVSVAIAESNGYEKRRGARNPNGSVDRGLWAINDQAHRDVPDAVCDDAWQATLIARRLYLAHGWGPWSSFANGQYRGPRAMGYAFDGISNALREMHGYPLP